jgi:hypothetical protein
MTWQTAKSVAAQYLRRLALPADLTGATIRLTDYESPEDLAFMKPGEQFTLEFHRMVNGALARELRRRGATVTTVKIIMAEYFDWLVAKRLANDPASRAQFILEKTT